VHIDLSLADILTKAANKQERYRVSHCIKAKAARGQGQRQWPSRPNPRPEATDFFFEVKDSPWVWKPYPFVHFCLFNLFVSQGVAHRTHKNMKKDRGTKKKNRPHLYHEIVIKQFTASNKQDNIQSRCYKEVIYKTTECSIFQSHSETSE